MRKLVQFMHAECTRNVQSCTENAQGEIEMKTVLFCNQKGGVGKTLLADETAFHFEKLRKTNFMDLDMQGGAIHETKELPEAEIQIIDTPGALMKEMKEWIAAADVVVIPTNCNRHDMIPLQRMMEIASNFDKEKFIVVFNRWNRFSGTAEFVNWFNLSYPGYKTLLIPNSVALTDAAARNISIQEFKPKHKAALAIEDLMNLIDKTLGE